MAPLNRRQFLALSATATSSILLSQCGQGQTQSISPPPGPTVPTVHRSQDGLLAVQLEARPQRVTLGDRAASLLTYNGQVPGPRLEARSGDTVQIQFINQLSQPTNLHFHGLHIPPTGSADNVFLSIPPGESYRYEFKIPENHPAGTFWYHPHPHGLVAEQVFGGLAGLFVIRGDLDEIAEIQAAAEAFLVLKDFALDQAGRIPPPGHMAQMTGRAGGLLTANGQLNPSLAIDRGGLLRLRLLNASASRFFQLSLEQHSFYLIATDGGAIAAPVELQTLVLAPGERAEVLVQGNQQPGTYRLLNQAFNPAQGLMEDGMGHRMDNGSTSGDAAGTSATVATLTYGPASETGAGLNLPLPAQLLPLDPLPEPQMVRQFTLNHGMARGGGMVFLINGQAFEHDRVDTQVRLGTIEDWEIINTGTMVHPFHLHINDFQVVSRNDQPVPYLGWKDVVSVAPGERVKIRIPFRDYPGKTVYHCHVLDHEDLGMMGLLEIQPA